MKVTLPSGKRAQIWVTYTDHQTITRRSKKDGTITVLPDRKGAHISLEIDGPLGGIKAEGRSICNPCDVFTRAAARLHAVKNLLDNVGSKLLKQDCEAIIKIVCPRKPNYHFIKKENSKLKKQLALYEKFLTEKGLLVDFEQQLQETV